MNKTTESNTTKSKKKTAKGKSKKPGPKKKVFTSFTCTICSKQFTDKYLLRTHAETHSTTDQYACNQCDYTCKVRKYLFRHRRRVHQRVRPYACEECGMRFYMPSARVNHMRVHSGEKPNKCEECGKAFNSLYSLNTHKLIHTNEKPYQCSFCEYACRDSSTLRKHQARHTGTEKLYQCKTCNKTLKSKHYLKNHIAEQHLQLDLRKHFCDTCGKGFKEKGILNKHVSTVHQKSNACTCEICGTKISNRYNLGSHMMTHVEQRPYRCLYEGCGKRFKDHTSLRRHSILHYPDQYYRCEICEHGFSREIRLKHHLLTHLPRAKNVECDYCGTRFYNKNYLVQHIRRKHTGKRRAYICDMCDFETHNKPSLVMHIKYGHVSEKNLECIICKTRYKKHMYLKMHYARSHGVQYKTVIRKPEVEIKVEPIDEDERSIDLFEIEKEELLEDLNPPQEIEELHIPIQDNSTTVLDGSDSVLKFLDLIHNDSDIDQEISDSVQDLTENGASSKENRLESDQNDLKSAQNSPKSTQNYSGLDPVHSSKSVQPCSNPTQNDSETAQNGSNSAQIDSESVQNESHSEEMPSESIQNNSESTQDIQDEFESTQYSKSAQNGSISAQVDSERLQNCLTVTREGSDSTVLNLVQKLKTVEKVSKSSQNDSQSAQKDSKSESVQHCSTLAEEETDSTQICLNYIQEPETIETVSKSSQKHSKSHRNGSKSARNCSKSSRNGSESKDVAKSIIKDNCKRISKVPEKVFDEHYIQCVLKKDGYTDPRTKKYIDKKTREQARKSVKSLLAKVRQRRETVALEKTRRQYNERMKRALKRTPKTENVKIKYFNNNKPAIDEEVNNDKGSSDDETSLNDDDKNSRNSKRSLRDKVNKDSKKSTNDEPSINNDTRESENEDSLINDNSDISDFEDEIKAISSTNRGKHKLKFNTHQCYICFKLYKTKELLLDHCKDHFDVCSATSLKKCPLCPFVAKNQLPRHLRLVHKITVKVPYAQIKDKHTNDEGSRYYFEINDPKIKQIEMIPSVRNLNKMASLKIDRQNRERKDKLVAKTKLVKKGKEWVVEQEKINVNEDFIIPQFDKTDVKVNENKVKVNERVNDSYTERLKKLSRIAKKNGKKMLFPCESCEKICQTLAALKLHIRKHDPDKKPFKKKVWKHKLKPGTVLEPKKKPVKLNIENRQAKPKPIKNKHKCDPELKEFYEKNIRGGDIEFWQFLKIYNKMDRENVSDFTDLERRTDFGIHFNEKPEVNNEIAGTSNEVTNSNDEVTKTNDEVTKCNDKVTKTSNKVAISRGKVTKSSDKVTKKKVNTKKAMFKRVIRISKKDYLRRNVMKNKLREQLAMEERNNDICME